MTRVRGGTVRRRAHNRLLERAKGFRMTRSKLYRSAHEAVLHAGEYSFAGRKRKKRDFRRLWITRLNAALRQKDTTYSTFISLLKKNDIEIDRKILAFFAHEKPEIFNSIVSHVMGKK